MVSKVKPINVNRGQRVALLIFLSGLLVWFSVWMHSALNRTTYHKGVHIEGVNVAGLDEASARAAVQQKVYRQDLGLKIDFEPALKEAYSLGRTGGSVKRAWDIALLSIKPKNVLCKTGYGNFKVNNILESSVIGECKTPIGGSTGDRVHNLTLACQKINGKALMPGETFSMDTELTPRTAENGYKAARVIVKDKLVDGTGGGVCQVTSTLYGAVLRARLDVIKRVPHTLPILYAEPGQDATVSDQNTDLKFKNSSSSPIYINAGIEDKNVVVRILGKDDGSGNTVRIRSDVLEEYTPRGQDVIIDNSVADGRKVKVHDAAKGYKATVYRDVLAKDGTVIKTEKISEDVYKALKAKFKVNDDYYD